MLYKFLQIFPLLLLSTSAFALHLDTDRISLACQEVVLQGGKKESVCVISFKCQFLEKEIKGKGSLKKIKLSMLKDPRCGVLKK